MKLSYRLRITVISIILLLKFPAAQQKIFIDNAEAATQPKTYFFGLRRTSAPISFVDEQSGAWKGYCSALIQTLMENNSLHIKILSLEQKNRFTGRDGDKTRLDAECGNDTITPQREKIINNLNGKFSAPFGCTGTAALLFTENLSKFNSADDWKTLKFGAIHGTTTRGIVNNAYPSLDKKQLVDLIDNLDGITQLTHSKIDVYFHDEIILQSVQKKLNETPQKYVLTSELLSKEQYGVIVYHTNEPANQQLLQMINSLLNQAEFKDFGKTKLKIFKSSYFDNFVNENTLAPKSITKLSIWIRTNFSWIFWLLSTLIIFSIIIFLWWFKNYKIKSNEQPKTTGATENNHSLSFTKSNANTDLAKFKSFLPVSMFTLVQNIISGHSNTGRDHMPSSNNFEQSYANINAGVQGTNEGNSTQQVVQSIYNLEQKQDLETFANNVQRILGKIEKNKPNATEAEKRNIVSYEIPPDQRSRIVRAFKAGGEKALEEFLDNPYLNVAIAVVKEWQKEE